EVQHAILTGIELDKLAEQNQLSEPLQDIIHRDEGLYGIDEIIAFSIVNVYGSIGFTSYGYIDKQKPGILKDLNDHSGGNVHTLDRKSTRLNSSHASISYAAFRLTHK